MVFSDLSGKFACPGLEPSAAASRVLSDRRERVGRVDHAPRTHHCALRRSSLAGICSEPSSSAELKSGAPQTPVAASERRSRFRRSRCSDPGRREGILGKEVRSKADENMGRIVDVIVDRTGQVRAAVIDFGGFLGVGNRKIAVDWNALNFAAGQRQARCRDAGAHARADQGRAGIQGQAAPSSCSVPQARCLDPYHDIGSAEQAPA